MVRRASVLIGRCMSVVAFVGCGTSSGDGGSKPRGAPAPSSATTDPTAAELRDFVRPPTDVRFCTSVGEVSLVLPGPVDTEGPRPLRFVPPPATGTFAYSVLRDLPVRYDAYVVEGANAAGSAEDVVRRVVEDLNGDSVVLDYEVISTDPFVEVTYVEEVRDRRFHSWAMAHRGVVISVSTSRSLATAGPEPAVLEAELADITATVDVSGLDEGSGSCGEPAVDVERLPTD